jgi:hypothetical protein
LVAKQIAAAQRGDNDSQQIQLLVGIHERGAFCLDVYGMFGGGAVAVKMLDARGNPRFILAS